MLELRKLLSEMYFSGSYGFECNYYKRSLPLSLSGLITKTYRTIVSSLGNLLKVDDLKKKIPIKLLHDFTFISLVCLPLY